MISFLGGAPPGALIVGSVLKAVGSLTLDEDVDEEVVADVVLAEVAGVAAAEVAPPEGARTTPWAVLAVLLDEPQPATIPPAATAMQRMESVFRMNAAGG